MRRVLFAFAAILTVFGCSNDIDYRPEPQRASGARTSTDEIPTRAKIVEKVGDADYSPYGIPIYPDAKVSQANKSGKKHVEAEVTLESIDALATVADWYKAQVKAPQAYVFRDLGTLEGTTSTGFPVSISITQVGAKTVIVVSIERKQG